MEAPIHLGLVPHRVLSRAQHREKNEATAFVVLLRACTKNKDLCKGSRLHDAILRRGLLENCLDALVTMYAKCGVVAKAEELFDMFKSEDVHTWTALIAACAQKGEGQKALNYFGRMEEKGLSPDSVTFTCILKACGTIRAVCKGKEIHDEIAKKGLLGQSIVLGTALVDMYVKFGALVKARQVLEELPFRNVVSWNALIAGYAQQCEGEEAFKCLNEMRGEGLSPNAVTFFCLLRACGSVKAADKGQKVHMDLARQGLLETDTELGNSLVEMYAKCGGLSKAKHLLDELPIRSMISWNALIAGYVQRGEGELALNSFEQVLSEGLSPDLVTFTSVLKACGSIQAVGKGEEIHEHICKQRLLKDSIVLSTAMIDMYAKCGALAKARNMFDMLPIRDVVSWNAIITGHCQQGNWEEALGCLEEMKTEGLSPNMVTFTCILEACGSIGEAGKGEKIHDEIAKKGLLVANNIVLRTALVDMYAKCGALENARKVLEETHVRDVISWSALITGYIQQGDTKKALNCFDRMLHEGLYPDVVTLTCILKACGNMGAIDKGQRIHEDIAKQGLLSKNTVLGNALVDMYAKCGALSKAHQVLEELAVRDTISWNSLITGYAQQGDGAQVLNFFQQMWREGARPDVVTLLCVFKACGSLGAADEGEKIHLEMAEVGLLGDNTMMGTALVDMYVKCGRLAKARQVLEDLPVSTVILWNALIAGYAQEGNGKKVLDCFERMQGEGLSPDAVTFACILKACGSIGAADKGEEVHDEIAKQGLLRDNLVLGTALVDMYAKCGALAKARRALEGLSVRAVATWNALIAGYAQQSEGGQALECLERMQQEGLCPDAATFSSVLSACSHAYLLEEAQTVFLHMGTKFGMKLDLEHYTCIVDLFGRVGHLHKAVEVIEKIPSSSSEVWYAVLGACRKWGDVNVGRWAFERALEVDKNDSAFYVLMANTYMAAGMKEEAAEIEILRVQNKAWDKPTTPLSGMKPLSTLNKPKYVLFTSQA